jgi:exodeoxyribonuclease VII large subunit
MPAKITSQWDFGELFSPAATRRVFSVTELTTTLRRLLEKEVGTVWITGEVTNLRAQGSGHIYFTLKDASAQLSCVLFRSEPVAHRAALQDGQRLILHGELTVYEARGQYQLIVRAIELQGIGALQAAFEKLKHKLQAEGLFALERKRALPKYPQRLGLVTSSTGAAIRDVLHVIQRRQPGLEILLAPCRVQGEGAAVEIAAALRLLNQWHAAQTTGRPRQSPNAPRPLDLILVTRGGGSLEDLWAFNEEVVARAIYESALPVVSAIGHEIDFTISDFVADVRAATPSAAAELITEGVFASRRFLAEAAPYLRELIERHMAQQRDRLRQGAARLTRLHPRRHLEAQLQYVDDLSLALARCVQQGWRDRRTAWQNLQRRLSCLKPALVLRQRQQRLNEAGRRLYEYARSQLQSQRSLLAPLAARLRLLAPDNVLARGYSITTDAASGQILRNAAAVRTGQGLKTRLAQGEIRSTVEE